MFSKKQKSSRSPTATSGSESTGTGSVASLVRQTSMISQDAGKSGIPPAPPLLSTVHVKVKTPSLPSPPPSQTDSDDSTPTQSTEKRSSIPKTNPYPKSPKQNPPRTPSSVQESNSSRDKPLPKPKKPAGKTRTRVSARDIENENFSTNLPLFYTRLSPGYKSDKSVFERVDIRGRRTSYMGQGSYTQIEDCIRDCLAQDRYHRGASYSMAKYSSPLRSLTRASVLEDYSYDGITSSYHHLYSSSNRYHNIARHSKSPADLSLGEIRHVNDALARYGIPVFSHNEHFNNTYRQNRTVGDLISACQRLVEDPALTASRNGSHAVKNVWDNLHNYQLPSTSGGYAPPTAQSVVSHLFNNNPHILNPPSQSSFPIAQQPAVNPSRNILASLFSGQPQQYSTPATFDPSYQQYPANNYQ